MKFLLLVFMALFSVTLMANGSMLRATPYKFVQETIGKGKPHFVEFGSDSCSSCKIMGRKLYKIKKANQAYNIEFVNVKKERQAAYEFKIRMIPTQVVFDKNGKEVYRHIGVLSDDELKDIFNTYKF